MKYDSAGIIIITSKLSTTQVGSWWYHTLSGIPRVLSDLQLKGALRVRCEVTQAWEQPGSFMQLGVKKKALPQ